MSEIEAKPKAQCRNSLITYLTLALLLSVVFGYAIGSGHSRSALVELADQQMQERASIIRRTNAEKKYLREQLVEKNKTIARQSDQLATNGGKAADAAIQLIDKQAPEVKAQ